VPKPPVRDDERMWDPTSADNHLYLAPKLADDEFPFQLLYVDCEGIHGGEHDPLMARLPDSAKDVWHRRRKPRQITWSDKKRLGQREFRVETLYPRILYNFCDVVVYVITESATR
jgi:hypothetical protein